MYPVFLTPSILYLYKNRKSELMKSIYQDIEEFKYNNEGQEPEKQILYLRRIQKQRDLTKL